MINFYFCEKIHLSNGMFRMKKEHDAVKVHRGLPLVEKWLKQ